MSCDASSSSFRRGTSRERRAHAMIGCRRGCMSGRACVMSCWGRGRLLCASRRIMRFVGFGRSMGRASSSSRARAGPVRRLVRRLGCWACRCRAERCSRANRGCFCSFFVSRCCPGVLAFARSLLARRCLLVIFILVHRRPFSPKALVRVLGELIDRKRRCRSRDGEWWPDQTPQQVLDQIPAGTALRFRQEYEVP